jgi:hypothetical protein
VWTSDWFNKPCHSPQLDTFESCIDCSQTFAGTLDLTLAFVLF